MVHRHWFAPGRSCVPPSIRSFPEIRGCTRCSFRCRQMPEVAPATRDPERGATMSGHSKWATIKHKKGAADAKRGKLFAKLIRQVEVAARNGGGDPDMNPTLRTMYQKALRCIGPSRHDRSGNQAGNGRTGRGVLRGGHLRGLRPRRRGDHRGSPHRQPEPHGPRRAVRIQQTRWVDGRTRSRGLAVRTQGNSPGGPRTRTRTTS